MSKATDGSAIHELMIPPFVQESGGTEVLRAYVDSGGGLSISFKSAFEDPSVWGIFLMDVARHVARGYISEGRISEADVLAEIRAMFDKEWDRSTSLGRTQALNN